MNDVNFDQGEKRNMPRWSIGEEAAIDLNDALHTCTILDISASGAKIQCDANLAVDDEFSLQLHGIQPLQMRVIRVQTNYVAALFVDGPHYLFR